MRPGPYSVFRIDRRLARISLLLALVIWATGYAAAQTKASLPVVVSASVPFYPRVAQTAHILGDVRLRISTDGKQVSAVETKSGPPILAEAAKQNIRTWRFEEHSPTSFETTFTFTLLTSTCDAQCNCDSEEKPEVLLRLPIEVHVSAKTIMTCDPAETRQKKSRGAISGIPRAGLDEQENAM